MTEASIDPRVGHRLLAAQVRDDDRPESGVVRTAMPPFGEVYLARSYETARAVLSDRRFSRVGSFDGAGAALNGSMARWGRDAVDGPEHRWIRRNASASLTTASVERLEGTVTRLADDLVSAMRASGPPGDFVTDVATPLTVGVAAALFGVRLPAAPVVRSWIDVLVSVDPVADEEVERAVAGLGSAIMRAVVRATPGPDEAGMVPRLLRVVGDDRQARRRIAHLVVPLLVGAVENPLVSMGTTLVALLSDEALPQRFAADPARVTEELLRLHPPGLMGFVRTTTCEVELDGVVIPAGADVVPMIGPANRDPSVFACPAHVSAEPNIAPDLSFGWGSHACIGAQLGRLELRAAATAVLDRLPGVGLAVDVGELPLRAGHIVDGYEHVPLTWRSA